MFSYYLLHQNNFGLSTLAQTVDPEPIEPIKEENPTEWWMPLCPEEELNNIEYSGKLMLLFSILAECEACGDKLLVFSQSLFSLDVIEHFLAMIDENTQNPNPDAKLGGFTGSWARGVDYFRLDGSTNIETRNTNCINFNSEENSQARYVRHGKMVRELFEGCNNIMVWFFLQTLFDFNACRWLRY